MSEYTTSRTTRYLPQVAIATTLVTIGPVVIVWLLLDEGVISSPWVCVGLAIALSLGASFLGSAYWQRRGGHGDVFFSELLLWGWLRRLQGERRLNSAVGLLGLANPDQRLAEGEATVERKAQLLRQMAAALDAQDPYTDGHSRRVALHSAMVARRMHVPSEEAAQIRTAAAIHDIGKLRIPPEVLNKPEALTLEEFAIVRRHADEGAEIVSSMEDPEITAMVRHHHERFDGGGYPSGLIGEQTPLGARIIAVADTFDALTSVRPYRSAIPHKRALDAIAAASGTQLDPVVVRTFLKCYSANRATVFWTLLAISPSRAVAWLRGRGAGQGNLASAGTVAAPAVIAAVFGMTLGSSATIFSRDPLAAAKKPSAAGSNGEKQRSSRAGPKHSATPKPTTVALAALPLRQSVLATNTVRSGRWASSHATRRAGSGAGSGPGGSNGGSRGSQGRSGANPGKPVKTAPPPQSGSPARPPTHHPHPVPTSGSPGAGGAVNPPASSAGNPGAQGGPGGSGGSNGGGGSGGSGGGTPLTKDDCKGGGYTQYNFPNQGQCVAFVERGSH